MVYVDVSFNPQRSYSRIPNTGRDKNAMPTCCDLGRGSSFAATIPVPATLRSIARVSGQNIGLKNHNFPGNVEAARRREETGTTLLNSAESLNGKPEGKLSETGKSKNTDDWKEGRKTQLKETGKPKCTENLEGNEKSEVKCDKIKIPVATVKPTIAPKASKKRPVPQDLDSETNAKSIRQVPPTPASPTPAMVLVYELGSNVLRLAHLSEILQHTGQRQINSLVPLSGFLQAYRTPDVPSVVPVPRIHQASLTSTIPVPVMLRTCQISTVPGVSPAVPFTVSPATVNQVSQPPVISLHTRPSLGLQKCR